MTNLNTMPKFGAIQRQHDPKEVQYAAARPAKAADWSRRVGATKDQRAAIWSQRFSDCTASICEALETAANVQGRTPPDLSHHLAYWLARERQGWVSRTDPSQCYDNGGYLADAAAVCRAGMAQEALWPYTAAHWEPPPPGVEADAPNQDWLLADRAIYIGPGAGDLVYDALNRGYTIQIGWTIRSDMYSPDGPYPRGLTPDPFGRHGFHASYLCRAFRGDDGEIYGVMPNSWGEEFNPRIGRWNPDECRAGEAVIPLLDWFERSNSPLFEARVLDLEPYSPPAPQPEPQPEPEDDMSFSEGYAKCREDVVAFEQDSVTFYQEYQPRTAFIEGALAYATWAKEQFENFLPPMAAPKYQRPSGAQISAARRAVYDPQTGRPVL